MKLPGNMQQMMRQVQKMQQDMMEAQEALKHEEVEASAGGGMVKVKVSGDLVVKSVTIAPDAIDPDDPEMHVSHETIYQSLYVQSRGGLRRELAKHLRTGRSIRKPRRRADEARLRRQRRFTRSLTRANEPAAP